MPQRARVLIALALASAALATALIAAPAQANGCITPAAGSPQRRRGAREGRGHNANCRDNDDRQVLLPWAPESHDDEAPVSLVP